MNVSYFGVCVAEKFSTLSWVRERYSEQLNSVVDWQGSLSHKRENSEDAICDTKTNNEVLYIKKKIWRWGQWEGQNRICYRNVHILKFWLRIKGLIKKMRGFAKKKSSHKSRDQKVEEIMEERQCIQTGW